MAVQLDCLRCEKCGRTFVYVEPSVDGEEEIRCAGCERRVPIVNGVLRFACEPEDDLARRTQKSFGYEWTHFKDATASGETNFQDYFHGIDLRSLADATVLDAGCGMGRHARYLSPHAGRIIAVDFSSAIEAASANLAGCGNVYCLQADLTRLPLVDGGFDFIYSMGVLHHLADTEDVLRGLVRKLKYGGRLRLYLYWKRKGLSGRLLRLVDLARRASTRLPHPLLRVGCLMLSILLWIGVVLPYQALFALGIRRPERWPLVVYTKYPFAVLYNDQFDRFSAPLEKRYSTEEAEDLLRSCGLTDVHVQAMYGWLVDGVRPNASGEEPATNISAPTGSTCC